MDSIKIENEIMTKIRGCVLKLPIQTQYARMQSIEIDWYSNLKAETKTKQKKNTKNASLFELYNIYVRLFNNTDVFVTNGHELIVFFFTFCVSFNRRKPKILSERKKKPNFYYYLSHRLSSIIFTSLLKFNRNIILQLTTFSNNMFFHVKSINNYKIVT